MRRAVVLVAILLAAGVPATGCVDGEPTSVFIAGNQVVSDDCSVSDTFLVSGSLDLAARDTYNLRLAVRNQLRARSSNVGADPNGVHFRSAEVSVENDRGTVLMEPDGFLASGFVPASEDGETPGAGTVVVPVRLSGLATSSGESVHILVRLFGETNGELSVSTGQWAYVVRLCQSCMLCPEDEDPTGCTPGQDGSCY
jgi:hypothetical protein